MIGRLIGLAGLAFSLMGGVAIAAEPPEIEQEDISGLMSLGATFEVINGVIYGHSRVFTFNTNESGDLFVVRMFSVMKRSNGRSVLRTSIQQGDCSGMRVRSIASHTSIDSEMVRQTDEPTEWNSFSEGSEIAQTCTQAYHDRAVAERSRP